MTADTPLPYVDEHTVRTTAAPERVWAVLTSRLPATEHPAVTAYAHLVGTDPRRSAGTFPAEGSAIPGFAVETLEPPQRLVLRGRHRFSRYRLTFSVEPDTAGSVLTARTDAAFPGVTGRAYRLLAIGSGIHGILVGRFVQGVGRRAERET